MCETTSMNLNINLLVNRTAPPFDNAGHAPRPDAGTRSQDLCRRADRGHRRDRRDDATGPRRCLGIAGDVLASVPGFGPDIDKNRAEARALMEKQGYGPEQAAVAQGLDARHRPLHRFGTALIRQLKEIYIDAELDIVETSLWFARLGRKDYVVGLNATGNGVDDPDQTFYESFACTSARNYTGYCNPEIEKLFDAQSSETDMQKRRQLVHEIDVRLLVDGARPPITWKRGTTCQQPYVKGYVNMVNRHLQRLPLRGRLARQSPPIKGVGKPRKAAAALGMPAAIVKVAAP